MVNRKKSGLPVYLLFPPLAPPMMPNLGLPMLMGHLMKNGVEAGHIDLNIRLHDDLLHDRGGLFSDIARHFREELSYLDQRPCLSAAGALSYFRLLSLVCRAGNLADRQAGIADRCAQPEPDLEPLPFGYPGQQDAFAMINLAMAGFGLHGMALGENTGAAIRRIPPWATPLLERFFTRHLSVLDERCRLIGISLLYESQVGFALLLAAWLRRRLPRVRLVAGGPYLSKLHHEKKLAMLSDAFDTLVIGEGEQPLLQLCGEPGAPAAAARDRKPGIMITEAPVAELPRPVFEPDDLRLYWGRPLTLMIQAGRSCYWGHCAFCAYRACYSGSYRCLPPRSVIAMIRKFRRQYNCHHYEFVDDCLSPSFLKGFVELAARLDPPVRWSACLRLEKSFTGDFIRKMAAAGCRRLTFGMESVSQRVLDYIRKGVRAEHYLPILTSCKEAGIAVHLNWIAGLPGERPEELEATIAFLREHADLYDLQFGQVFTLEAASPFAMEPERYQLPASYDETSFYSPEEKKRLRDQIDAVAAYRKEPSPRSPLPKGGGSSFNWSGFVTRQPVHYPLNELKEALSGAGAPARRQEQASWVVYHTRSHRYWQTSEADLDGMASLLGRPLTAYQFENHLKSLYEQGFVE